MRSGRRKEKSILTRFIVSVGIVLAISVAVIAAFLWWYTARTLDQYHDSLLQQCQLAGKNAGSDIHALLEQSKIPVYREPAGHDTSYLRQFRPIQSAGPGIVFHRFGYSHLASRFIPGKDQRPQPRPGRVYPGSVTCGPSANDQHIIHAALPFPWYSIGESRRKYPHEPQKTEGTVCLPI